VIREVGAVIIEPALVVVIVRVENECCWRRIRIIRKEEVEEMNRN